MSQLLLLGLFSASVLANSPANLSFISANENWAVVPQATGRATGSTRNITVELDNFTILANPKFPAPREVLSYRVCIAYQKSETVWDMAACSKRVKNRVAMQPGQTETVDSSTLAIPAKHLSAIGQFWFVLDVEISGANQVGDVYAHSENLPVTRP